MRDLVDGREATRPLNWPLAIGLDVQILVSI